MQQTRGRRDDRRLSGRLDRTGTDQVLIDVRSVGHLVIASDRTMAALPPLGETAVLWTDLLLREDLLQLFAFPILAEREWHRLLMTAQGIGASASGRSLRSGWRWNSSPRPRR
jgi:Holliday junction DNA helicase RuvA